MPDIQFIKSPKTEVARLEFVRRVIEEGFYQKHGFVVLPELDGGLDKKVQVVYPKKQSFKETNLEIWEKEWRTVNTEFWGEIKKYFPDFVSFIKNIEVRITEIGTVSSSGKLGVGGKNEIYYLRSDADISHLAAMIINNILYTERKKLGITWTKREALMDFIMTRPKLYKLFPKFEPVFSNLGRVSAKVRKKSKGYVNSLGLGKSQSEIELLNGQIMINGKLKRNELTKKEKQILKLMIERKSDLITYDEIADHIWGVGEFKTYWAINKLMERLRKKLSGLGVTSELISVRGQGYLLK